jgi:hypothetical protein
VKDQDMKPSFEPLLHPIEIKDLRPTQMTVGLREVARKRLEWRRRADATVWISSAGT